MKTRIVGQKYLNSNLYENIVIGNKEKDKETINITASTKRYKNTETIKTSTEKFMDSLKGISEEEKLEEVINYFLRNNLIYYVKENNGLVAMSTSDRKLHVRAYFKQEDFHIAKKMQRKIVEKYESDRLQFLEANNDVKNYRISAKNFISYSNPGDFIELSLLSFRDKDRSLQLTTKEEEFLKSFIMEKIIETDEETKIKYRERYKTSFGEVCLSPCFKICCGDLRIYLYDISGKLERELGAMIMNYNYSREENLKRQLKLEGI